MSEHIETIIIGGGQVTHCWATCAAQWATKLCSLLTSTRTWQKLTRSSMRR